MRTIGVATFARSDYSSLLPLLRELQRAPDVQVRLWVGGAHLEERFGGTWRDIERDGFAIHDRIAMPQEEDSARGVTQSMARGLEALAASFARSRPDLLVLVGDRTEMLMAATAALVFRIPVAHISGGDVSEGAIDNQVRFAVTEMSHLHFVAMQEHADRLVRMGEEPWRVEVSGDPALDLLRDLKPVSRAELSSSLGLPLQAPVLVVTHHPATLSEEDAGAEMDALCDALAGVEGTLVITHPNADSGHGLIVEKWKGLLARHPRARLYASLGQQRYYSLLQHADLMVGNSSSAFWEAPTFRLPAVNVGDRQAGRHRAGNVIDASADRTVLRAALARGLDPAFRAGLAGLVNPYGDGHAAPRIARRLREVPLDAALLRKRAPGVA